jgi:AraC family transcriptional regulator
MDWITGIQNALDYIENHLTEEIDYEQLAKVSFSSTYHFQRVFSILCGYSLGEYIRNRRLSLAGTELAAGKNKVIDVALKYGYDSPDSFTKAFVRFHGITPSQAKEPGAQLKSFSPLSIKITLEGGSIMSYKLEEKPALTLTGFKRRFTGTPGNRDYQDHNFLVSTRADQFILQGAAHDSETIYEVTQNFGDDGYDYYLAAELSQEDLYELGAETASRYETVEIPAGLYLVCTTERSQWPFDHLEELWNRAVTEWLPFSGYELTQGPEVSVIHWFYRSGDMARNQSRYVELWLPLEKKN